MAGPIRVAAIIPVDLQRNALGMPARAGDPLNSTTVLGHTLQRLSRCEQLDAIAVICADRDKAGVETLIADHDRAQCICVGPSIHDPMHPVRLAARKWSPTAWRGGLGGTTCCDELLNASAMTDVLEQLDAQAMLLVGPDWPLVDPALCDAVVARHREHPRELKTTFTQAPPGFCGVVIERGLLADMARDHVSIGALLEYRPAYPQPDPIAMHTCVQIDAALRDAAIRATADAPRWMRLLEAAADELGPEALATMSATDAAKVLSACNRKHPPALPQQITLELTPTRPCTGPITPQHHIEFTRPEVTVEQAKALFEQLVGEPDVAVTLGGFGDALCHEHWAAIVEAAVEAGIWGVAVETDLHVSNEVLEQLVHAPVDVVVARLNADTPATYEQLMGADALNEVRTRMEWLLNHRRRINDTPGLPWLVPSMIKTRANVTELESFFDRWMHFAGHAVVAGPSTYGDRMPDASVLDMAPPKRFACRQLARRMTVLSSGAVCLCDQDVRGDTPIGSIDQGIGDAWSKQSAIESEHQAGKWDQYDPCRSCQQWHRP